MLLTVSLLQLANTIMVHSKHVNRNEYLRNEIEVQLNPKNRWRVHSLTGEIDSLQKLLTKYNGTDEENF